MNKDKDIVLGVFSTRDMADNAVKDLRDQGYKDKNISVIMKDPDEAKHLERDTAKTTGKGAASGALAGLGLGGTAGLVVGLTVVPGGFIIGGPIAAALGLTGAAAGAATGATTGAVAGGVVGGLAGLGLSRDKADDFGEMLDKGSVIVSVPTEDPAMVRSTFSRHSAVQLEEVPA